MPLTAHRFAWAEETKSQWKRFMQEYDVALKLLLRGSAKLTMRELTGTSIEKWLDVELPKVQSTRVDLLGETGEASLVHLELQSGNDASMPLRMAEYCLGVFRLFEKFPRQALLYVAKRRFEWKENSAAPICVVPIPRYRHSRAGGRPAVGKRGSRGQCNCDPGAIAGP